MPDIPPLDIMKEVGRLWSNISIGELETYKKLAQTDLLRYRNEHQLFVEMINKNRRKYFDK
jgi:hypothetical protein